MANLEEIKAKILELNITLLPVKTLDNIEFCIRDVVKNGIEGDFIETGVWKGGAVIYAHHVLKELGSDKIVYAADSYEGLPKPNVGKYPVDAGDPHWAHEGLRISLEEVTANFNLFGEPDGTVIFIKGWFRDTLYDDKIKKLSVLRLDGDMYESTWEALDALYPKLSIGGYCIVDDYGHARAKRAVEDYRENHAIDDEITVIDTSKGAYPSAYWKKTK